MVENHRLRTAGVEDWEESQRFCPWREKRALAQVLRQSISTQQLWPPTAPQPPTCPSRSVSGLISDWFLSTREGSLSSLSSAWHVVSVSTDRNWQCSLDPCQALGWTISQGGRDVLLISFLYICIFFLNHLRVSCISWFYLLAAINVSSIHDTLPLHTSTPLNIFTVLLD